MLLLLFFNGFFTGAAINYSFAHVLFLTPIHARYMVTAIVGTARGFSASFAAAAGALANTSEAITIAKIAATAARRRRSDRRIFSSECRQLFIGPRASSRRQGFHFEK